MMESESLTRFRQAVDDDKRGTELTKLLAKLAKAGFEATSHEELKRVPKGYDPEHPRAKLLKAKGLIVTFPPVPKRLLTSPKLVPWLAAACKKAAPLVELLAFATA